MELLDKDKRDGYIYDVVVKGNDSNFWKATSGAATVASNKLRINATALASYIQHLFGDYEFSLNVPTTPSAGEAKHWGLRNPATDNLGAIYFEISGTTFRCVSVDDNGTSETTNVTWSSYENADTEFRIMWEPDLVRFLINGTVVATHATRIPTTALSLRIVNSDADNTDLAYLAVRRAAAIV